MRDPNRFKTVPVYNRTNHKVTAMFDGVDEEWAPHEVKHLQINIAWHCLGRTVLRDDPATGITERELAIMGLKDDDGNDIPVDDLSPEDEKLLRAGQSRIPLEAMAPPEGFVPGEDGEVKATVLKLPTDIRYTRGTAPEITNASRLEGGKRFEEPRPGWNADMEKAAAMAADAAAVDAQNLR